MESRSQSTLQSKGLAKYLSEDDQLAMRAVSKTMRKLMAEWQPAPYQNKKQFVLGVSGAFVKCIGVNLAHAWANYKYTMQSDNLSPAILYKLTDSKHGAFSKQRQKIWEYSLGCRLDGVIYVPPKRRHCWAQNQVWVLAQVHKQRSFKVISNVSKRNFMRQQQGDKICAFAKEIATVMQAGYGMEVTLDGNIILTPPLAIRSKQAALPNLDLSEEEMRVHYARLREFSHQQKIKPNKVPHSIFGLFTLRLAESDKPKTVLQSEFELQDFSGQRP